MGVVEIRLLLGLLLVVEVLETVQTRSPLARAARTRFDPGGREPSLPAPAPVPVAAPARARPDGLPACCFCCLLDDAPASLRCARLLLLGSLCPYWVGGGRRTATVVPCGWPPPLGWRVFLPAASWASRLESAAAACVSCLSWELRPTCLQGSRECDWHSTRGACQETWKELIWFSYLGFLCPVPCTR